MTMTPKQNKLRGLIYNPMSDVWMALAVILITVALLSIVSRAQGQTTRPAPTFITAVFQQPASSLKGWKARGINTVINTVSGVGQDVATDSEYVAAAHAMGLYVIANAPGADALAQRDEADGNGVPTATTYLQYLTWQQANATLPVYLNLDGRRRQFTALGTYRAYFQGADWLSMDRYPVSVGAPQDIPLIAGDIETMKAAAPGKRVLYILECGDQHLQFSPWLHGLPIAAACRPPTLAELKQEIALCVSHGVTGIGFFTHDVNGNVDPATGIGGWKSFDSTTPEIAAALPGICATLTGVPIVFPTVVTPATKPVVIPPPTTQPIAPRLAKRTRVLITGNPTLIQMPNIRWTDDGKGTSPDTAGNVRWVYDFDAHDAMVAMGYEEAWMLYDGTIKCAPMWTTLDTVGNPHLNVGMKHDDLDWSLSGEFNNPPTRNACLAIGQLIRRPQTFRPNGIKPHAMVIFDIEGSAVINGVSIYSPLKDRLAAVNGLTQAIKWIRQSAGGDDQEVCVYGDQFVYLHSDGPEPEIKAALDEFTRVISCRAPYHYFWDWTAENSDTWLGDLGQIERNYRRYSPEHIGNKFIVISPIVNVYNPENDVPGTEKIAGIAIPMPIWMAYVDWLIEHDYSILVWTGNTRVEPILPQLQYVAGYQRGRN